MAIRRLRAVDKRRSFLSPVLADHVDGFALSVNPVALPAWSSRQARPLPRGQATIHRHAAPGAGHLRPPRRPARRALQRRRWIGRIKQSASLPRAFFRQASWLPHATPRAPGAAWSARFGNGKAPGRNAKRCAAAFLPPGEPDPVAGPVSGRPGGHCRIGSTFLRPILGPQICASTSRGFWARSVSRLRCADISLSADQGVSLRPPARSLGSGRIGPTPGGSWRQPTRAG